MPPSPALSAGTRVAVSHGGGGRSRALSVARAQPGKFSWSPNFAPVPGGAACQPGPHNRGLRVAVGPGQSGVVQSLVEERVAPHSVRSKAAPGARSCEQPAGEGAEVSLSLCAVDGGDWEWWGAGITLWNPNSRLAGGGGGMNVQVSTSLGGQDGTPRAEHLVYPWDPTGCAHWPQTWGSLYTSLLSSWVSPAGVWDDAGPALSDPGHNRGLGG